MSQLGYVYRLEGDLEKAEPLIREALDIDRKLLREPDISFANNLTRFGILLQVKGDYSGAAKIHQEALALRRDLFEPGHPRLSTTTLNVAVVLTQLGDYATAQLLARESLLIAKTAPHDEPHIKTAYALRALGTVFERRGRTDTARVVLGEALAMFIEVLGENNRHTASTRIVLGRTMSENGEHDAAETELRHASSTIESVLGINHPMMVEALTVLADIERGQFRLPAAAATAHRALDLAEQLNVLHPRTASAIHTLARVEYDQGDGDTAENLLRQAVELRRQSLPDIHLDLLASRSWLGTSMALQGRFLEAEPLVLKSFETLRDRYGEQHFVTRQARLHVVALYNAWGKPEAAVHYLSTSG